MSQIFLNSPVNQHWDYLGSFENCGLMSTARYVFSYLSDDQVRVNRIAGSECNHVVPCHQAALCEAL